LPDEEPAEDPAAAPLFRKDTAADKAVRFGCGAILGALVAVGGLMAGLITGLPEPFGMTGVIVGIIVLIGGAGLVCVTHGEPAIQVLLKLIKWLA
jgi:hypothetical protein